MKEKRVKVFFELFVRKGGKSPFSGPFPHESEVQSEVLTSRIMGIIRLSSLECCELSKIFEVVRGRHSEPARHFEGFLKGGFFVFAGSPAKNRRFTRAVLSAIRRKFANPQRVSDTPAFTIVLSPFRDSASHSSKAKRREGLSKASSCLLSSKERQTLRSRLFKQKCLTLEGARR